MKTKKNLKKNKKSKQKAGYNFLKDIRYVSIVLEDRNKKFDYFQKMSDKFKKMDIKLEKFSAIDMRSFDTRILSCIPNLNNFIDNNKGKIGENFYTLYQDEMFQRRNLGSLGVTFSHSYLYRKMIEKNIKNMIIFEEDAIINNNFKVKLNEVIKNLPSDWDIVFLGMSCDYNHDKRCHKNDKMVEVGKDIYTIGYIYGLYGYLINTKGAKKILDNLYPIWWHLDTLLSHFIQSNIIKAYAVVPNIVFHPGKFKISSKKYLTYMDYDDYETSIKSKDIEINNI